MKYLIVGLGNIGTEYADTRHNIGFMVADKICQNHRVSFQSARYAYEAAFKHKGRPVHIIKPTTYMNLSGKAVRYWLKSLKIPIENTLVIVDDIALPFGTIRIKLKGSSAGHNGLKDIENQLQTSKYPRLKFGIGDHFSRGKQVDYVLGNFTPNEQVELPDHIDRCAEAVMAFCSIGANRTMNQYNK